MKLEDKNFEEEFMNWLKNKTEEELVDSLKKYAVNNDDYSYEISSDSNLTEEYYFDEIDIERKPTQINMKKEIKEFIEIEENIELEVAA